MSLFSRTCVSNNINPQVLFFYGHGIHFNDRATNFLQSNHISPFIFKAGNSTNDHPNDNGPNLKLKIYCGLAKVKWPRQHGTTKFTPTHNCLFSWRWGIYFNNNQPLSSLMPLKKTNLLPLGPLDHDTNAQASLSATQTPLGTKSEEIREIVSASTAPVSV